MRHGRSNWFLLISISLATVCALVPRPAVAIPGVDAHCRYKVANAARLYADYLTKRIGTCHLHRLRGKLPAAIDCNDPSTWSANGYSRGTYLMQRTVEKATKLVEGCRPEGLTPASVGYTACPAPCGGIAISTFTDVATCALCVADACSLAAADQVLGTMPLPAYYAERRCQQILARKLNAYTINRSYLEANCQFNLERGKPGFVGLDCLDPANPANTMHFIYARSLHEVDTLINNQCGPIDMAVEIDSCGATAPAAVTCLIDHGTQCADAIFAASFPAVP